IKAPRLITHYKQFKDCEKLLNDFYSTINECLKDKLGCVLFQFPPKFEFTEERLNLLMANLKPSFRNVIEFRNVSWLSDEIFDKLGLMNITVSGMSFPSNLPDSIVDNTKTIYYRFHGKPVLYKSEYDLETIQNFAKEIPEDVREVYIYFNNTWGVGALNNSKQLQKIVNHPESDNLVE
ncbi:MAG: DUF72 domain-containing protein, partial [Sphingobacteriales bacterium]